MENKKFIGENITIQKAANILSCYKEGDVLLKAYNDTIQKAEGARGGKVIGHTKSGKPIYESANHPSHKNFSIAEHNDAIEAHQKVRDEYHNKHNSTDEDKKANDHAYEQQKEHIGAKNHIMRDMTPAQARAAVAESEANNVKKSEDDDITKGGKAVVGEIRTWGGKKYKKQPNGKWMEVSEHYGKTKQEHQKISEESKSKLQEVLERHKNSDLKTRKTVSRNHKDTASANEIIANRLSDKEYTEEELSGGEPSSEDFKNMALKYDDEVRRMTSAYIKFSEAGDKENAEQAKNLGNIASKNAEKARDMWKEAFDKENKNKHIETDDKGIHSIESPYDKMQRERMEAHMRNIEVDAGKLFGPGSRKIETDDKGIHSVKHKGSQYWSKPDESKEDFAKRVRQTIKEDHKDDVEFKKSEETSDLQKAYEILGLNIQKEN